MRRQLGIALSVTALLTGKLADAGEAPQAASPPAKEHGWLGGQMDVGVPDGAAVGAMLRPGVPWAHLGLAYTYGLASGVRAGATLDPVNFPIAPTLTVEAGHTFEGSIHGQWLGLSSAARGSYTYANLHLGLEFGKRDRWRIYLRGGASMIAIHTSGLNTSVGHGDQSVSASDPNVNATVLGTAKLGFAVYFW